MTHRKSQRGATLIESMIAIVVVAIGSTGIVALNNASLLQTGAARDMTVASALAQDLAENMTLWPWNDARLAAGAHAESELGTSYTGLASRTGFTRAWSVAVSGKTATVTINVTTPKGTQVTTYTARADTSGAP